MTLTGNHLHRSPVTRATNISAKCTRRRRRDASQRESIGSVAMRPLVRSGDNYSRSNRKASPWATHTARSSKAYLVPRPNGRMIAGSTLEDVGFEKTRDAGRPFEPFSTECLNLRPASRAVLKLAWTPEAGLRPGTPDHPPNSGADRHSRALHGDRTLSEWNSSRASNCKALEPLDPGRDTPSSRRRLVLATYVFSDANTKAATSNFLTPDASLPD